MGMGLKQDHLNRSRMVEGNRVTNGRNKSCWIIWDDAAQPYKFLCQKGVQRVRIAESYHVLNFLKKIVLGQ